jgi:hypothetical protein
LQFPSGGTTLVGTNYPAMKTLLEQLQIKSDLSEPQAKASLLVIHQWLEQHYPILAVISKATVLKEVFQEKKPKKAVSFRSAPSKGKLSRI